MTPLEPAQKPETYEAALAALEESDRQRAHLIASLQTQWVMLKNHISYLEQQLEGANSKKAA